MTEKDIIEILKLTENNYWDWKYIMETEIEARGWGKYVWPMKAVKEEKADEGDTTKINPIISRFLIRNISPNLYYVIRGIKNKKADTIWESLKDHFIPSMLGEANRFRGELHEIKMKEDESIEQLINRIETIIRKIELADPEEDEKVTNAEKLAVLTKALPLEYKQFLITLEIQDREKRKNWNEIISGLKTHERLYVREVDRKPIENVATFSLTSSSKIPVVCRH